MKDFEQQEEVEKAEQELSQMKANYDQLRKKFHSLE
jgi:DnaJ-domain-containing protein 1